MAEPLGIVAGVTGLVTTAAQVKARMRLVKAGAKPVTAATSSSAVEEFRDWTRANVAYECRDPNEQQHRDFVHISLTREYFGENDCSRLKRILDEFNYGITVTPRFLRTVFDEFLQVLCILIEIGGVEDIESLMIHGVNDQRLPVDLNQLPVSLTSNSDVWKSFCGHQWRYCVPEFNIQLASTLFHHERILPIVSKEEIGQGATATTYKIQILPLCDKFERNSSFQNENTANTYALKSFVGRDSKYYLIEIDTYQKLAQCHDASLVQYYGSYVQDNTFNIVLELADRGSLEQYFSYCQPPNTGADILRFWGSLFKIVRALICIHEAGGSPHLYGVHQNIKPETILVRDNSLGSQYGWEFKLGGLGSCQFSKDGNFSAKSAFGTRTYGSPECYLTRQESSVKFNQNYDIWSLGCIFSEVAVWIASGYHGVQKYRILRKVETDQLPTFKYGDCFHNGKSVLRAVRTTHHNVLPNLRQSDAITAAFLGLVESRMLVSSDDRLTAKQLWQEVQEIVSQAETVLERRKGKLPEATAPSTPQGISELILSRQQGTITGTQGSLSRHQLTEYPGTNSSHLRHFPQTSPQVHSSGLPGDIDDSYVPGLALSGRYSLRRPSIAPSISQSSVAKQRKSEAPYLSVGQALQWKEHAQSQGRIGLGNRVRIRYGSSSEQLPHSYLRERLRGRKYVFLIDTAKRMEPYWHELTTLVGLLAYIAKSDDDIEMFSNDNLPSVKSRKSTTLVKSLERTQLMATSAIDSTLGMALQAYTLKLQGQHSVKPMSLYVFTDGMWHPQCDLKSPIHNISMTLRKLSMPAGQVAIQFIRFGSDNIRLSRFDDIDAWTNADLDIVDTESSNGNVWKMLLGAIDVTIDIFETEQVEVTKSPNSLETPEERFQSIPTRTPPPSPARTILTKIPQDMTYPLLSHGMNRPSSVLGQPSDPLPSFMISNVEPVPFHDSGYEGSTERQLSLITKSVPESSLKADHSYGLPGTQDGTKQVGSAEPSQQDDSFAKKAATRDQVYDIRSIISDDLDIQSTRSSKATYQERLAEQNLGFLLALNPQLRPLSEEALHRVGKIRFVDNLRRLLKRYFLDLRPIATTKLEIATVNLLRSRYSRARLSQQISDILAPENDEMDEQFVQHAENKRQELENWIIRNPEFVPPQEEFDDFDLEIDGFSSDEEVIQEAKIPVGEVHEEAEEPNLPNIAQMESFLLTCGGGSPFQRLSTHLRIFLLPPALGPLVRILMSLPEERVWLNNEEDTSFSNKFKSFVEDMTEENWNWWPLRPRMRLLEKDQMRLHWICHCNTHLWTELPRFSAEKLQALVRGKPPNTQSPHLCARCPRNTSSLYARVVQAAGFAQNSTGSSSIYPSSNTTTAATGIHLNPMGLPGPSGQASSPPTTRPSVTSGQGVQVNITTGTISELFVLFGVKGSRRTLELAQIDVSKHKEDSIFFQDLRREYRQRRGFWRYWLSVWQLRHCDFVKFEKIRANRVISNKKHDLPVDILYEYTPRPPNADIPPIDPHEFELSLSPCNPFCVLKPFHDCIEPPDGGVALERIPKRKRALELKIGNREQAWGLLAQHSISALLIFLYQTLIVAGPFAIWGWWQGRHPDDIQGASTPFTVVVALLCLFWGSAGVLKVLRDTSI